MEDLLTKDDALGIAIIGIGVPVVLSIAGQIPNGAIASAVAASLLGLFASMSVPIVGKDAETVNYALIPARLFTLAALGEAAYYIQRRCTRRIQARAEMRMYDCTALLVCAFLVIGQIMDSLSAVLPAEADTGTFLGIVIAGLSFSLRDLASCLVAGLHENITPRFHPGDKLLHDGKECTVTRKALCFVDAVDTEGSKMYIPQSAFTKRGVVISAKGAKDASDA